MSLATSAPMALMLATPAVPITFVGNAKPVKTTLVPNGDPGLDLSELL